MCLPSLRIEEVVTICHKAICTKLMTDPSGQVSSKVQGALNHSITFNFSELKYTLYLGGYGFGSRSDDILDAWKGNVGGWISTSLVLCGVSLHI